MVSHKSMAQYIIIKKNESLNLCFCNKWMQNENSWSQHPKIYFLENIFYMYICYIKYYIIWNYYSKRKKKSMNLNPLPRWKIVR